MVAVVVEPAQQIRVSYVVSTACVSYIRFPKIDNIIYYVIWIPQSTLRGSFEDMCLKY